MVIFYFYYAPDYLLLQDFEPQLSTAFHCSEFPLSVISSKQKTLDSYSTFSQKLKKKIKKKDLILLINSNSI